MNAAVDARIVSGDTGVSSKAIWARMKGIPAEKWGGSNHPEDPDDLGRCLRLLAIAPEWRARLDVMRFESPEWAALVAEWSELTTLWLEEGDGTWRPPMGTSMPRLYAKMRSIIDGVRKEGAPK